MLPGKEDHTLMDGATSEGDGNGVLAEKEALPGGHSTITQHRPSPLPGCV